MGKYFPAFKAYDIRGVVPTELGPELAYRVGRAYADVIEPKTVCVGYDIRLSGPEIYDAFARGLNDAGVDVVHLGMIGSEMVYFATAYYGFDGGCMITASHNPAEYNGLKFVRAESRPISGDTGLNEIEEAAFKGEWKRTGQGTRRDLDCYDDFVRHLLSIVPATDLKPLKVLCDAGNGAAGLALDKLNPHLPLNATRRHFEPDGNFPNGVPNPILEEQRAGIEADLKAAGDYDFGVAWDGDYDRCFFLDGRGNFIEGYYIVGLLAQALLHDGPSRIVYDPRLTWNTIDIVDRMGGEAVICKSGHAFIKEKMRAVDAVYGGEMSAHHYFKSHWYCDSGMIPFLLVARLVSKTGKTLADLVDEMIAAYPCSGEVNSKVADVPGTIAKIEQEYAPQGKVDHIDGLSVEFSDWRFNLRGSNTEPLLRLNVESRGNRALMEEKTAELLSKIRR
ncbi:phosphomannomutase [bacterium]|nr:MAG: phosphomannomutase [bacterium]